MGNNRVYIHIFPFQQVYTVFLFYKVLAALRSFARDDPMETFKGDPTGTDI